MATIYANARFTHRADTLENWQSKNPVLLKGEPSIVTNGAEGECVKIGDGVTDWNHLPYIRGPKGEKGEKGDTGDKGEKGEKGDKGDCTGIYLGSGPMPDDCNVQIDPDGESLTLESLYAEIDARIEKYINEALGGEY